MNSRSIADPRRWARFAVFLPAAALGLVLLAACSGASTQANTPPAAAAGGQAGASSPGDSDASGGSGDGPSSAGKAVDGCTLISAADLSQAVGVTYTSIESNGGLCTVTAATQSQSFVYHVDKEDGTVTTWDAQVATIKQDDGSVTPVSGVGDRAVQGAIKEFAAESKGYIVVVDNADLNNPSTYKDFTRSKKVAQALIGKL